MSSGDPAPAAVVERLEQAINRHDLDALVACFAADYLNETPVHPARGFRGNEQVRRNWTQIFAGFRDFAATLVRRATDGEVVWAEWEFSGTRAGGSRHVMRGVTIVGVRDGLISWARFYMEPVEEERTDVDTAVRQAVTGQPT